MSSTSLPHDPLWPRAGHWLRPASGTTGGTADLAVIGIPANESSITPSSAHTTPPAVREALLAYSTWAGAHGVDISTLTAVDLGDVDDPHGEAGERRVSDAVAAWRDRCELLVAIGGDNSITFPVMRGLMGDNLGGAGLITLDAHHDLRDGLSNGSPVRRLVEAGVPGSAIVQIGIADFSNSAAYAARARDLGITVVSRGELRRGGLAATIANALAIAGRGGRRVYVDIDVDVCDRAEVPACPAAAPGGITADELRQIAYALAEDPRVRGIDITEIDAAIDAPDRRTVRLAALLILEAAAGLSGRTSRR